MSHRSSKKDPKPRQKRRSPKPQKALNPKRPLNFKGLLDLEAYDFLSSAGLDDLLENDINNNLED